MTTTMVRATTSSFLDSAAIIAREATVDGDRGPFMTRSIPGNGDGEI